MRKQSYAGIDLHSNNLVVAIVDQSGKRLSHRRLPCSLNEVLEYLNEHAVGKIQEISSRSASRTFVARIEVATQSETVRVSRHHGKSNQPP